MLPQPPPLLLQMVSQSQFARVAGAKSSANSKAALATQPEVGDTESPQRAMRTLLSTDDFVTPGSTGPVVSAPSVLGSWVSATGSITYQVCCWCTNGKPLWGLFLDRATELQDMGSSVGNGSRLQCERPPFATLF